MISTSAESLNINRISCTLHTHTTWSFNRLLENHAELLSSHTFTCHLICLCYGTMRNFFETVKQCGLSRRIYCDTGDKQVTKGIWIFKDARKHRKTTHKTVTVPITINVPENEPSVKTALVLAPLRPSHLVVVAFSFGLLCIKQRQFIN